jgi:ABC-type sugar transport system permease subunit
MTAIPRPRRPRLSPLARREARWGYIFIAPWLVGFALFILGPMIATLVFTFTNVTLSQEQPLRFVGLENYGQFMGDQQAWNSLAVTFKYALIAIPVALIAPLSIALVLNSRYLRGTSLFRAAFFMPYVVPFVAGVFIWGQMLNAESGWINEFLRSIGVDEPPNWLNDTGWVYPSLVILGIWGIGSGIVVNLAGLQGIPTEYYDAARIDGAGFWATLRHVTLPLVTPVLFYTLVLSVVGVLQYFLVPLVLNNGTGEPGGSTLFFNLYLYKQFFTFQNMSYGATLAWILFAISLVLTIALFRTARHWVYYAGERT